MEYLAPALTEDEKVFLREHSKSEQFRVFSKAVTYLYSLDCARLSSVPRDDLPVVQGRLQGLLAARNILVFGKLPDQK
jgi:hypothetical protein